MSGFEQSKLWQKSLAPKLNDDINHKERELLRVEYEKFREKAALVANEIARDLPQFTLHDITHIDSLWNLSDLITNDNFELTPPEAFVLGGAFLIHDLGMGLAAYPDGIEQLKKSVTWRDSVSYFYKRLLGKTPTESEINNPEDSIEKKSLENVLRLLHAKHAENLALIRWENRANPGSYYYLIENPELRESYGKIIGSIAHSHWWSIDELAKNLHSKLGAPGIFPHEWIIDPIKIATLLRIADASNIDDRRSPGFLRAIRKINGYSDMHWNFQQKLYQPRVEKERFVYSSKSPFTVSETDSWWLCYDTLKLLDGELKDVDSLLASTGRTRLGVVGVYSIEDPERLLKIITVENWKPIDTQIRVGSVAQLALKLGGTELYGMDLTVPIRELIQNSTDAIRARRILENENENWGDITVRVGIENELHFIEIEDNGIGMSTRVLTGPFLDFGQSFWGSQLMHEELPGLESKKFESTGKFGIGFFSIFMLGEKVSVYSRRYEDARENTWCLEFYNGLNSRPILRKANNSEYLKNGGTRVKVIIPKNRIDNLVNNYDHRGNWSFEDILEKLCASLDANLFLIYYKETTKQLIAANDWTVMPMKDLIRRTVGKRNFDDFSDENNGLNQFFENAEFLIENEVILGRCVLGKYLSSEIDFNGIIAVGGLEATDSHYFMGILKGKTLKASRDAARPLLSKEILKKWAESQMKWIEKSNTIAHNIKSEYAGIMWQLGCSPDKIPFVYYKTTWINYMELVDVLSTLKGDLILTEPFRLTGKENTLNKIIVWNDNLFALEYQAFYLDIFADEEISNNYFELTLFSYFLNAVSAVWNVPYQKLYDNFNIERNNRIKRPRISIGEIDTAPIFETSYYIINRNL